MENLTEKYNIETYTEERQLEKIKLITQLHIVEYQNLTTFITYMVYTNYGLVLVGFSLLIYVMGQAKDIKTLLAVFWQLAFCLQIIELIWLTILSEIYVKGTYLEEVREKISILMGNNKDFWRMEKVNKASDADTMQTILEYIVISIIPAATLGIIIHLIFNNEIWKSENMQWMVVNLLLMIIVVAYAIITIRLKRNFKAILKSK